MADKVKFGLKNAFYAKLTKTYATSTNTWTYTYGTPVAMPGAVSISLAPQGDKTTFRADNIDYWVSHSNNGYEGDFENALLPASFYTDILGEGSDSTKGIRYEKSDDTVSEFAFLFQIEGDDKARRFAWYRCVASRPGVNGQTTDTTITPNTDTITITALPREQDNLIKGVATDGTGSSYANWFTAVQEPTIA